MANWAQFGMEGLGKPASCAVCEAMLHDAVDGTLSAAEQRVFYAHVAGCVECARELEEAQRGAAWLAMLKAQTPEPPASLLTKILAETTGVVTANATQVVATPLMRDDTAHEWANRPAVAAEWETAAHPATIGPSRGWGTRLSAFRSQLVEAFSFEHSRMSFQPRLAMTAAMAFFSIALTLNLTGVRLRDLRAENFTPSGMRRSVADMGASAARSFQNLRVVYQVESRVSELRSDEDPGRRMPAASRSTQQDDMQQPVQPPQQNTKPQNNEEQPKKAPKPQGSSDLVLPMPERAVRGSVAPRKEV